MEIKAMIAGARVVHRARRRLCRTVQRSMTRNGYSEGGALVSAMDELLCWVGRQRGTYKERLALARLVLDGAGDQLGGTLVATRRYVEEQKAKRASMEVRK